MKIENRFTVAAPMEQVWVALADPARVGPCIPGCEAVERIAEMSYKAALKSQLGALKVRFNLLVEVLEETPPSELIARVSGEEGTHASVLRADTTVRLSAVDANQTAVVFAAEVSIVGRFGKFGLGVMKKQAERVGQSFGDAFRREVEAAGRVL